MAAAYEILEHPGDLKIRAHGASLEEAFANAGRGLMAFLFGAAVLAAPARRTETLAVAAQDRESLLVDWLSELLWHATTAYAAYVPVRIVEMTETRLVAEVGVVAATATDDIKAVTYHELDMRERDGGWDVTVVCDI